MQTNKVPLIYIDPCLLSILVGFREKSKFIAKLIVRLIHPDRDNPAAFLYLENAYNSQKYLLISYLWNEGVP